jgi:hypothetical protein
VPPGSAVPRGQHPRDQALDVGVADALQGVGGRYQGDARPEKTVEIDARTAATVANTVAKPSDNACRAWTALECRPRPWPAMDGPGRCAHSYGSEGWGFESLRARPGQRPLPVAEGAFLLTPLLTAASVGGRYRAGEDVGGLSELVADDVGVHAQRDRGVGVAEPGGDHMHGDASQQQGRGVDVPQIV